MTASTHHELVTRLIEKIRTHRDQIIRIEGYDLEDAEVAVISYGCTARSARHAVRTARQEGIRAGLLRLISIWPFAEEQVVNVASRARSVIVAEMNLGQISREVERCIHRPVRGVFTPAVR